MPTHSFTARWVQAVRGAPGQQIEYFDEAFNGLVLRINQNGKKTWRVAYRTNGKWRRVSIGAFPLMSLADAREGAQKLLGHVADGRDPADERKMHRQAGTFAELAAEYLEKHAKKRKRSWQEDERILYGSPQKKRTGKRPHEPLVKRWGHLKVIDIRRRDVRQLLDEIAERAPIMANRVLACVRKMFNYAIKTDWPMLESNPCMAMERPGVESRRDRVLNADEIRTLWTEAGKERLMISTLVRLELLTAQRSGELMQMAWDQIDFESGWWTIPAERSKNKLPHRVPLAPPALAMLKDMHASANGSQWVFQSPKSDHSQPIGHAQKAIERIRSRAKFDFRGHDLRRTAASHMTSIGIPRLVVSKILNHAEPGVTAVYDRHSYDAEKRAALNAWAREVMAILKNERHDRVVEFTRRVPQSPRPTRRR